MFDRQYQSQVEVQIYRDLLSVWQNKKKKASNSKGARRNRTGTGERVRRVYVRMHTVHDRHNDGETILRDRSVMIDIITWPRHPGAACYTSITTPALRQPAHAALHPLILCMYIMVYVEVTLSTARILCIDSRDHRSPKA